jgi:hypothetical protein
MVVVEKVASDTSSHTQPGWACHGSRKFQKINFPLTRAWDDREDDREDGHRDALGA